MLISYKEIDKQQTWTCRIVNILLTEHEKWQHLIILSNLNNTGKFLLAKVIFFLVLFRVNWFFFLLLAALIIEQTYTSVMGFYLADNTQNILQTWNILLIKSIFAVIKQTVFKLALRQSNNQQHFARDCTLPAGVEHCACFSQAAMLFTILHL